MSDHPQPWQVVEHEESFEIRDALGGAVHYVYFEDEPLRRTVANRMDKAAAKILADDIVQFPDLLDKIKGPAPKGGAVTE